VDVVNASNSAVVAYAFDPTKAPTDSGRVSVSYGFHEVVDGVDPIDLSMVKYVQLENLGTEDVTYDITYVSPSNTKAGPAGAVTFTLDTTQVTVAPVVGATVGLTMNVDASLLRHYREATVASSQSYPRHWLTEESGYLVFTPTVAGPPVLRVPVHAALRPASEMTGEGAGDGGQVVLDAATGSGALSLEGIGVSTGATSTDERSSVSAFLMQYESSDEDLSDEPVHPDIDNADLKAVGAMKVGSTVSFGIATWATGPPQ